MYIPSEDKGGKSTKKVVFKGRYSVSVCSLLCYGSLGVSC